MKRTLLLLAILTSFSIATKAQVSKADFKIIMGDNVSFDQVNIFYSQKQASAAREILRNNFVIEERVDASLTETSLILDNKRLYSLARIYFAEVVETNKGRQLTLYSNNGSDN